MLIFRGILCFLFFIGIVSCAGKSSMSQLVDVKKLSEIKCSYPIQVDLKYASHENFIGRVIDGYDPKARDIALLTPQVAYQLIAVQNDLNQKGLGLLIYDAYRPKRAVQDFLQWSKQPAHHSVELVRKQKHYPDIDKTQLFPLGYVAEDSGHCYGNTVDLVLIDLKTGQPLKMGVRFDYMGEKSHLNATPESIGVEAFLNRQILQTVMMKHGFEPYPKEFWHFSYRGEKGREVSSPMDVRITEALRGVGVK